MFDTFVQKKYGPTVLFLVSDFTFVMMDGLAQKLQHRGMSTSQVMLLRFRTAPELFADLFAFRARKIRLIWIKGALVTLSLSSFYLGLKYLPISDVIALYHLKPFPTAIMCMIVLKEMISRVQIAAMVISIGAVLLVTQPTMIFGSLSQHQASATELIIGYAAMTVAAVMTGVDLVLVKVIGIFDSVFILLVLCINACVLSAIYLSLIAPPETWAFPIADRAMLLAICSFGFIAQVTNVIAIQHETGIKASLMGYFQIPFAAISQVVFTFTVPSPLTVVGSLVIVGAGTWSVLKGSTRCDDIEAVPEGYEALQQDDPIEDQTA